MDIVSEPLLKFALQSIHLDWCSGWAATASNDFEEDQKIWEREAVRAEPTAEFHSSTNYTSSALSVQLEEKTQLLPFR